jgi:hypothetical protein
MNNEELLQEFIAEDVQRLRLRKNRLRGKKAYKTFMKTHQREKNGTFSKNYYKMLDLAERMSRKAQLHTLLQDVDWENDGKGNTGFSRESLCL